MLVLGVIGIFSLLVCTPLMFLAHWTGLEPQLPLPDRREFTVVLLNGIIGSVLSDYLWLYATLLTNSLISSISLTLTIPLSMFADAFFRQQFPDPAQLLAAIPIMVVCLITSTHITLFYLILVFHWCLHDVSHFGRTAACGQV